MSADLASVNAAREDTKAILANLQKGQILLSTTSKDIKPMNFAWVGPKSGVTALKALSETATKFPVYNLSTLERYESPTKAREAPITYDPTQLTVNWQTENHATYHNIAANDENNVNGGNNNTAEQAACGLKSAEHVRLPTQFAWTRMNNEGLSDKQMAVNADAAIDANSEALAAAAAKAAHSTSTKENVLPGYEGALPVSSWKSVNHADFPLDPTLALGTMPESAGSPTKSASANPSNFAWGVQPAPTEAPVPAEGETTGDVMTHYKEEPQSEYIQAFHAYTDSATNEVVKKSCDATLEGVFYSPDGQEPEPAAESDEPENAASDDNSERDIMGGTHHYKEEPISENLAAFRFDGTDTGAYTAGLEHVKKSAEATLPGVFSYEPVGNPWVNSSAGSTGSDTGSEKNILGGTAHYKVMPETENAAAYHLNENVDISANVNHVHQSGDITLAGVFNYANVPDTMQSENRSAYPEYVEESAAPASVDEATPAPEPAAADDMCFEADVSEPAPAPAPAVEAAVEPAAAPEEREREMATEAPLSVTTDEPAPAPVPAPEAEAAPAPAVEAAPEADTSSVNSNVNPWMAPSGVVYQSTSNSSFQWPSGVSKPNKPVPVDADMMGGTAAPAAQGELQTEMEQIIKPAAQSRYMSEYNSNFSMPKENMNKRAVNSKTPVPDSLWVLGTKGDRNAELKERQKDEKVRPPMGDAEVDHLRGTAAMPHASDSLEFNTIREVTPPSSIKSTDAKAGYTEGVEKNVLRSDGAPIPGQIPFLREEANLIKAINRAAGHRTPQLFTALGMPPGMNVADPIQMYRRYPVESKKQANRFATTSRAAYKWPSK